MKNKDSGSEIEKLHLQVKKLLGDKHTNVTIIAKYYSNICLAKTGFMQAHRQILTLAVNSQIPKPHKV